MYNCVEVSADFLEKLMQLIYFFMLKHWNIFYYYQYCISTKTYRILVMAIAVTRMTTKEEPNDPVNISLIEFFVSITKNIHILVPIHGCLITKNNFGKIQTI